MARDFLFMARQCYLCPRRSQGHKLHWRAINKKLRAINIYNARKRSRYYYYNSFSFQKHIRFKQWDFLYLTSRNHCIVDNTFSGLHLFFTRSDSCKEKNTKSKSYIYGYFAFTFFIDAISKVLRIPYFKFRISCWIMKELIPLPAAGGKRHLCPENSIYAR